MAPPDEYVDPNFPNPNGSDDADIIIYGYRPNFALCLLGLVLFGLILTSHTFQVFRYRYWAFILMILGCVMEIIGYAFRLLSSRRDPYAVSSFVAQYFCITCAPIFISASIYIYLTEFIFWAQHVGFQLQSLKKIRVSAKKVLWIFISADIFCTALQITGAALIGSQESDGKDPSKANDILIAGLAVQVAAFLLFLVILLLLIRDLNRPAEKDLSHKLRDKRWAIVALSVAGLLVFLRTVFRLAESSQGVLGYLSTHEAFFGALEFSPIIIASVLLSVWHPGRVFSDRKAWRKQKQPKQKKRGLFARKNRG